MKIKLAKTELIHFVGIGGIGMNGLALIMKELGFKIQGSDISFNKNIERLKKNKIKNVNYSENFIRIVCGRSSVLSIRIGFFSESRPLILRIGVYIKLGRRSTIHYK